jgi:DNA adenine methylase
VKPPFTYFGGKTSIADQIAALLPPHEHYVEAFAGSLAVLLAKGLSPKETANDIDGDIVNFWRMLRDRPDELIRACSLTPHSRAEYAAAYEPAADDLERARRTWVAISQGRAGTLQQTGWRNLITGNGRSGSVPGDLAGYVGRMASITQRLARVTLECRPAIDVIKDCGASPDVLIYADPPYLGAVRSGGATYRRELRAPRDHEQLAAALRACRATVVLSGYHSPLYEDLYAGWHVTMITSGSGQGSVWKDRTEVLWSNRPFPVAQLDLFSGEAS